VPTKPKGLPLVAGQLVVEHAADVSGALSTAQRFPAPAGRAAAARLLVFLAATAVSSANTLLTAMTFRALTEQLTSIQQRRIAGVRHEHPCRARRLFLPRPATAADA